jgi:hypothetical protein
LPAVNGLCDDALVPAKLSAFGVLRGNTLEELAVGLEQAAKGDWQPVGGPICRTIPRVEGRGWMQRATIETAYEIVIARGSEP